MPDYRAPRWCSGFNIGFATKRYGVQFPLILSNFFCSSGYVAYPLGSKGKYATL